MKEGQPSPNIKIDFLEMKGLTKREELMQSLDFLEGDTSGSMEVLERLNDNEIIELSEQTKIFTENNEQYANSGNFVLALTEEEYKKRSDTKDWCCDIQEVTLQVGDKTIYLGFDCNH